VVYASGSMDLLNRPWDAINYFPIGIYPFALGLAFLMSLDLSFSCRFSVIDVNDFYSEDFFEQMM
jgi:hypothetical protein